MGYPTKVQIIKRKDYEQWYINFPAAIAHTMEFVQSEQVEWVVIDKQHLLLKRTTLPPLPEVLKKKRHLLTE